jgi:two-component system chemotaxis response regulator CheB
MQTSQTPLITGVNPMPAMSRPIRILVVDDSVVVRRMLSRLIEEDLDLELVGFAANGSSALDQDTRLKPDVITMDVEMPEMDGLTAVRALRRGGSTAVIIMCSAFTTHGARSTIEALMRGANDYVTMPSTVSSTGGALETLRQELIPKIKQFSLRRRLVNLPTASPPKPTVSHPSEIAIHKGTPAITKPPSVIAIGVSTGGPTALLGLLPRLPGTFRLPIVIVQHMPPLFTRQLADRLSEASDIEVLEATEGMPLLPGRAVLAPGDQHMKLIKSGDGVTLTLDRGERENSCRPSVDVLFHSVAEVYGGQAIGVILTGMGQDGLRGVEKLKSRGAYIIAQNRESSVVWGMPGAVVQAGLADSVLPLEEVASAIMERVAVK